MTVYLAFSELDGLDSIPTNVNVVTTGSSVVSGINRAGISLELQTAVTSTLPTPLNEGWVHARIVPPSSASVTTLRTADFIFCIVDGSGNRIAGFYTEDNNISAPQTWRATYFADASLFSTNGNSGTLLGNTSGGYDVDLHFKISDVDGFLRWYVDGSLVREVLGDTQNGASNVIASVRFRACGSSVSSGAAHWTQFSQVIVANTPTLGARLHTLPLTVSTTNQWAGTPTNVTGTTSLGVISEATVDEEISFNAADLATAIRAGYKIDAAVLSTRSLYLTGSSVTRLQGRSRIGGTPYNIDTLKNLSTGYTPVQHIASTDPSTGSTWTTSGLNAAEFGLQAKA